MNILVKRLNETNPLALLISENPDFVLLGEEYGDKYSFGDEVKIDCENRVHLCRAACCRLRFPLSKQDLEDGVEWDKNAPYMNRREDDGYCYHLNRDDARCSIWTQRPLICRAFDCRDDHRIWLDFDNKIVNPGLNSSTGVT